MNFTPITPKTARCQCFTTSSPTLNESTLHELQQSILENGITENSPNDQMKLEMAGKIGSALLAENSCLNDKLKKDETQSIQKVSTQEQKLTECSITNRKRKVLPKIITGNLRRK